MLNHLLLKGGRSTILWVGDSAALLVVWHNEAEHFAKSTRAIALISAYHIQLLIA